MTGCEECSNQFVSIVIPAYSDPEGLRTTLKSAIDQSYNDFEIIVAITPTSGETLEVAEEFKTKYPDIVHIVKVVETGRAKARNEGIAETRGDIIAFVDADIWLEPNWLKCAVTDLRKNDAEYLACQVKISLDEGGERFVERYDQALSIPVQHYVEDYNFAPTAALLLTRELIREVDHFDPELTSGEDRELGNRVYNKGYDLAVSDCEVYHPPRTTIWEQIQKAIRIGIGMEQLRNRYPDRYSFPSLFSPLSYAPPSPKRLKSRLTSNSYTTSLIESIGFYLFNYTLKLFQQFGRWKQFLSN
ncbi:glycosyltransferase [Halopenitus salinus]|uniref:Glycosyltransferase n=1 Tax=Halopenitus salinus TaxID=1198295 RepID=A0ABD5UWU5_9EURY